MTRKHTSGAALHAKIGELMVYTLYPLHARARGARGPATEKRTRGPCVAEAPGVGPPGRSLEPREAHTWPALPRRWSLDGGLGPPAGRGGGARCSHGLVRGGADGPLCPFLRCFLVGV